MTPATIRAKIAKARREVDQHEATAQAQQGEIDAARKKLTELLGCKEGKEKTAIKVLQARIDKNKGEVEGLLNDAEATRDEATE